LAYKPKGVYKEVPKRNGRLFYRSIAVFILLTTFIFAEYKKKSNIPGPVLCPETAKRNG
jgi:hypothetical protein